MADKEFTWLPFFEELLDVICKNYTPSSLYKEFKKLVPATSYNDINKIDPFTFIGCICGGNRVIVPRAKLIKENLGLKANAVEDFKGIPNFVHATYKYFHEIYNYKENERAAALDMVMDTLWEFARQINENNLKEETFNKIVNFKDVKIGKLSQVIYICKPYTYYSCDSTMLSFLYRDIDNDYNSFIQFQKDCSKLNQKPYDLSDIAWKYANTRKAFFKYLDKLNKNSYLSFIKRQVKKELFERTVYKCIGEKLFNIRTNNALNTLINELKNNSKWNVYNASNGSGIPHAILNTHYRNFINNTDLKNTDIIEDTSMETLKDSSADIPLNLILYGPPGTGKTHKLQDYIKTLLSENPGLHTENEEQTINDLVKDLNWYSAIALSIYTSGKNNKYKVPEIVTQKIVKVFSHTRESKSVYHTVISQLQMHTIRESDTVNYTRRVSPLIFNKTENAEWYLTEYGVKFVEEDLAEFLERLNTKNKSRKIEDFYKFITFHQSYSYEEFVEGIKPCINTDDSEAKITYEYNKGIFKEICQKANSDIDNKYLLVIDEINRGNISKIFGELITLIEPDKRVKPNGEMFFENTKKEDGQLIVTLPYTKSKFAVPDNLYIIGTMNTSDRSIASIDIALRRRFKFKEMMPDSSLVAGFGCGFNHIFEELNNKIKILLDRDHQIGHSYFINTKYKDENNNNNLETLKEIWYSEIIPLLNEYFYCDWDKLKLIIPGFIKQVEIPEYLAEECYEDTFEFIPPDEITDFKAALETKTFEAKGE